MKKLFFAILAFGLFALGGCHPKAAEEGDFKVSDVHCPQTAKGVSKKDSDKLPVIEFATTTYDFGEVIQGEKLSYSFKFKNTGKSNLIIFSSEATCGCTTSQPPKAPIRPGESGTIDVTFDSKSQEGKVTKRILVGANTYPAETILIIKANVTKA